MVCTSPGAFTKTQVFNNIKQTNGCKGSLGVNPDHEKEVDGVTELTVPEVSLSFSSDTGTESHTDVTKFFANTYPTMCPMTSCDLYEASCN